MEIILYITGGIALLALSWLFLSIASTVRSLKDVLMEVRRDLATIVNTVDEIKTQALPILNNVSGITSNVNSITGTVQGQMETIKETIDDALTVIRGTLEDLERLKDDVVATVEGPVSLARSATGGAVGAATKVVSVLWKFFGNKKKNGQSDYD